MKYTGCKIYMIEGERNDATSVYIDILQKSFSKLFGPVICTNDLSEIRKNDLVIVITMYSLINIVKIRFNQPFVYWFQGVNPEETGYGQKNVDIKTKIKKKYCAFWEWFALHKSIFNFFVSKTMCQHFKKKYAYKGDNYFIMPCFNKDLDENAFFLKEKYDKPSFVYAGGILAWQCVEESIMLFKRIKERYNTARFTILTGQKEDAYKLIDKHEVKDVDVKYVPLKELQVELSKYKYGFLLRQDDTVNIVATPTKFNSYLACGVIPIISEVIGDFNKVTQNMKYIIRAKDNKDIDNAFAGVLEMEKQAIDPVEIRNEYKVLFDTYYNKSRYVENIGDKLMGLFAEI